MSRFWFAALLALLCCVAPAEAQRIIVPTTSSGANQNLNNSFANCGQGPDGLGVLFTAVSGNTPTAGQTLCTLGAAAKGGFLYVGPSNNSSARVMVTLRHSTSTDFLINQYVEIGTTAIVRIPVLTAIPAGEIVALMQAGSAAHTVRISFEATLSNSQSPPLYTICEALNASTATTRPTGDLTIAAGGTTFNTMVADTGSNPYGALIIVPAGSGSTPTSQASLMSFATGAASSEVVFHDQSSWINGSAIPFGNRNPLAIEKTVPANSRLSSRVVAAGGAGELIRTAVTGCRS